MSSPARAHTIGLRGPPPRQRDSRRGEPRLRQGGDTANFEVHGAPVDLGGAQALAAYDKHQLQWWAVSLVNAQPYGGKKKGADTGIDGIIYCRTAPKKTERMIVSVKGGR